MANEPRTDTESEPSARVRAFSAWTARNRRWIWASAVLFFVLAAARTGWMYAHLRTDLAQLLPPAAPSVVALNELSRRLGGRQFLGVVVEAQNAEQLPAAERMLDDLAEKLRTYPPDLVASVSTSDGAERAFLEKNAALYIDVADLEKLRDHIAAEREREVAKALGVLFDDDDAEPSAGLDLTGLEEKYRARVPAASKRPGPRFTSTEALASVLVIEMGSYNSGTDKPNALLQRVREEVAALGGPEHYAPGLRLGYAGDAAISSEELSALVEDITLSTIVVMLLVLISVIAYYRWWRSVLVIFPPLSVATAGAFAIASLPPFHIRELNSNTAFLGSIIVGNGINFGIVLLSRYVEERRAGEGVTASIERAVSGARIGTLAAALAAGTSYASLALTNFRGFAQFGVIGGIGMLLSWGAAFLLIPPLLTWVDRDEHTRPRPVVESKSAAFWLSRGIARAPVAIMVFTAAVTIFSVVKVSQLRANDIETDFSRLRRRDTWTKGEGYWGKKMNEVLGEYLTPLVFLADDTASANQLAAKLRQAQHSPPLQGLIQNVRALDDVLPTQQEAKLAVAHEIKAMLTPRLRAALTPEQQAYLARSIDSLPEAPITLADLPRSFTIGLREHDGSIGKTVLVFPDAKGAWWDGNVFTGFVMTLRALGNESVHGAAAPRLAGALPLSTDIIGGVRHDAPIASSFAFFGVIIVTCLLLRTRETKILVVGSLITGVLWLCASSEILHVRINFANFIAFPITFGIGIDYAVNVLSRYEQDGSRDILSALRSTGAAVGLCSLTTVFGYSSLLMAQNQALFYFGVLSVVGELACLFVALVSVPALIVLRARRAAVQTVTAPDPARWSDAAGYGPPSRSLGDAERGLGWLAALSVEHERRLPRLPRPRSRRSRPGRRRSTR